MKKFLFTLLILNLFALCAHAQPPHSAFIRNIRLQPVSDPLCAYPVDPKLVKWLKANVSKETGLPLSFEVPVECKKRVYRQMGESFSVPGIIERMIVEEGLVIYDGAVRQIVLAMLGGEENLNDAYRMVDVFWQGGLQQLPNLRAGYPLNGFIYDPKDPQAVSSDLDEKGKRGFIFRIINANGRYDTEDPLDGKTEFKNFPTWPTVHWEDWKPVAGENAWIVIGALQVYHKKYFSPGPGIYRVEGASAIELKLAEELARAALLLQAENGGIRMAPIGTYLKENDGGRGWYSLISTENNLSWYAAFRMLFAITQNDSYRLAMARLEEYFKSVWNADIGYFYQGAREREGRWEPVTEDFATDVQTWGILVLGAQKIDTWFGSGAAYQMWKSAKARSGAYDAQGRLRGVGFTTEHDRVSVEWTAGAVFAARRLKEYYAENFPLWSADAGSDESQMREGIEALRVDFPDQRSAYAYSSQRGWIPFGWNSHDPDVLSLASTAWVVLLDAGFNPFDLPGLKEHRMASVRAWPLRIRREAKNRK